MESLNILLQLKSSFRSRPIECTSEEAFNLLPIIRSHFVSIAFCNISLLILVFYHHGHRLLRSRRLLLKRLLLLVFLTWILPTLVWWTWSTRLVWLPAWSLYRWLFHSWARIWGRIMEDGDSWHWLLRRRFSSPRSIHDFRNFMFNVTVFIMTVLIDTPFIFNELTMRCLSAHLRLVFGLFRLVDWALDKLVIAIGYCRSRNISRGITWLGLGQSRIALILTAKSTIGRDVWHCRSRLLLLLIWDAVCIFLPFQRWVGFTLVRHMLTLSLDAQVRCASHGFSLSLSIMLQLIQVR